MAITFIKTVAREVRLSLLNICAYALILSILSSCSQTLFKTESSSFSVEAYEFLGNLSITVNNKSLKKKYRIIHIESCLDASIEMLNDSLLFVTDIQCQYRDIGLLTNIQIAELKELICQNGAPRFVDDVLVVNSIESKEWKVDLLQVNDRRDMYLFAVYSPYRIMHDIPPEYMVLIGVDSLKMTSLTDGVLNISVYWQNNKVDQQASLFSLKFHNDKSIDGDNITIL